VRGARRQRDGGAALFELLQLCDVFVGHGAVAVDHDVDRERRHVTAAGGGGGDQDFADINIGDLRSS
jgi:hypothetical protein